MKIKSFRVSKDIIKNVRRQPKEWEKIFAIHISDKGLILRSYKELLQLNNKKNLVKKWVEDLNRHFSKEDGQ